ncbi:MAG: hypothetical protein ACP5VE_08680 [Chthonomonadales bacterium]
MFAARIPGAPGQFRRCIRVCGRLWGAICATAVLAAPAQGQRPVIRYVFPAGGRRASTFQATVAGTGLLGVTQVRVVPPDVSASVVERISASQVRISVTVSPAAEPGEHDLRVVGPAGASNIFRFFVGQFPEVMRDPSNTDRHHPQMLPSLPIVVNGQILEGTRNAYRFSAKAGETIVCRAQARALIPFIADAVPGWADLCLTLFDEGGQQIASNDDYHLGPDPVLICRIPRDGLYTLEVKDILDRGRDDFVYRLTVGAIPFITGIYPLGGRRGSDATVHLYGANLPKDTLTIRAAADGPAMPIRTSSGGVVSNAVPFALDDASEVEEQEPNDTAATARTVIPPVTINGRIDHPGDEDWFVFRVRPREMLVMEVRARRLGSPLDGILTLFGPGGRQLAENDDYPDPDEPLLTHQADPRIVYLFRAPGVYFLRLRDIEGNGGDEYAYRLTIGPPHPDFRLTVNPDTIVVPRGDAAVIVVTAQRRDGFTGDIAVEVRNLPEGFRASRAVIRAPQTTAVLTVTAPEQSGATLFSPEIVGKGVIEGRAVERIATGTERVMQAFSYTHYPTTREVVGSIGTGGGFRLAANVDEDHPLVLPKGGSATLKVRIVREMRFRQPVTLRLAVPVQWIQMDPVTVPADAAEATVTLTASAFAPEGYEANVVLAGSMRAFRSTIARILPAVAVRISGEAAQGSR